MPTRGHPVVVQNNALSGTGGTGIVVTDDGTVFGEGPHGGNTYASVSNNHVTGYASGITVTAAGSQVARVALGSGNVIENGVVGLTISGSGSVEGKALGQHVVWRAERQLHHVDRRGAGGSGNSTQPRGALRHAGHGELHAGRPYRGRPDRACVG